MATFSREERLEPLNLSLIRSLMGLKTLLKLLSVSHAHFLSDSFTACADLDNKPLMISKKQWLVSVLVLDNLHSYREEMPNSTIGWASGLIVMESLDGTWMLLTHTCRSM